jgi:hypothetical protein
VRRSTTLSGSSLPYYLKMYPWILHVSRAFGVPGPPRGGVPFWASCRGRAASTQAQPSAPAQGRAGPRGRSPAASPADAKATRTVLPAPWPPEAFLGPAWSATSEPPGRTCPFALFSPQRSKLARWVCLRRGGVLGRGRRTPHLGSRELAPCAVAQGVGPTPACVQQRPALPRPANDALPAAPTAQSGRGA